MRIGPTAALALAATLAACSTRLPPVAIDGPRADLAALAGEWRGHYEAGPGGSTRSGSILFRIAAEGGSAQGDVLMIPASSAGARPTSPREGPEIWAAPPEAAHALTIRFVHVAGGEVHGVLDPYRDPECGCELRTEFRGVLRGDVIEGTYASHHQGQARTTSGRWQVRRYDTGATGAR